MRAADRPPRPAADSYDYAVIRVVPRVEREEFVNVGVILSCQSTRFLEARIHVDRARLAALAPRLDLDDVQRHLATIPLVCRGGPEAGALGELSPRQRFHWLVAPRSTSVQVSAVHTGRCDDLDAALDDLMRKMVSR